MTKKVNKISSFRTGDMFMLNYKQLTGNIYMVTIVPGYNHSTENNISTIKLALTCVYVNKKSSNKSRGHILSNKECSFTIDFNNTTGDIKVHAGENIEIFNTDIIHDLFYNENDELEWIPVEFESHKISDLNTNKNVFLFKKKDLTFTGEINILE